MALIIKDLSFKYDINKDIYALKDINLELDNKIYALSGINGSGKSTLLELIDGLLKPTNGSIKYNNKKIVKSDVGFIFQFPEDEFFNKLVIDEIKYSLKNFNIKTDIKDILKEFNLKEDILYKKINDLSSGEKRLIAIISSIIYDPKIILLDEPTVNLDYNNKKIIVNFIKNLKDKLVIIISHDNDLLYEISNDLILLENGNLKYFGDISECKYFTSNITEFYKYAKDIKLMKVKCINDLIKEVYRNV